VNRPYPVWDPATDDAFICTAIHSVAPGVKTVVLAPRRPSTVRFDAGQYVTIEFDVEGAPVLRSYTIASPPTRPERIAITVKRTDEGRVSRWLHDGGMRPGTVVRVGEPQGSFTRSAHPARSCLLLTAGTGITPALSMLRESYDLSDVQDIVLVHSQRRLVDVPYGDEVEWMSRQLPGLRVLFVCSGAAERSGTDGAQVVGGRLEVGLLRALVPEGSDREVFICGPDSYRAAARSAALGVGCPSERIHEETFAHSVPVRSDPPSNPIPAGSHRIQFRNRGVTISCASDMTVLEAAAVAGLSLPSSCAQGLCGTCKSTLVSGEVDMRHGGGIRPREIAAGKVLLCCSRPLSDLVIAS
jgi:ferredoxin-NADP reductase